MVQIKLGETKKEPAKDTVVDVDNAEKETKAKTVPVGTYRIIRRTNTTYEDLTSILYPIKYLLIVRLDGSLSSPSLSSWCPASVY